MSVGYKKDIIGIFANEFELLHNRSFLVIFRLRRSDIFCYAKCDIETYGFSDIIFAPNARRHITCEANITHRRCI